MKYDQPQVQRVRLIAHMEISPSGKCPPGYVPYEGKCIVF